MVFVGLLYMERAHDGRFWSVLWQGAPPPTDFKLIAAYNLMTDLRVIVFEAESTATIRFLDRFNLVGRWSCHPCLDQTEGYRAAFARDLDAFEAFLRRRGASDAVIRRSVEHRRRAIEAESLEAALRDA
ncbi:MAG TPA: hypothetical protein VE990_05750 [Acidimicrobiales bacterium]|nr:hypothetical protein [Acidimicrobiales bacterium]